MVATDQDLTGLRSAGRVVALALQAMRAAVRPGITTGELDQVADRVFGAHGARSAPRLAYDFPGSTCISVNDEVVHGVPGARVLEAGDLVTLDVAAEVDGFFADSAITVGVGAVAPLATALMACAEAAFWSAAGSVSAGARLSMVGGRVEAEVERRGFRVFRELGGHGIGRAIHEAPNVSNYCDRRDRTRLGAGLVFALEPIISAGTPRLVKGSDGWTLRSTDGSLAAHFEHTLVVTRGRPIVLTAL